MLLNPATFYVMLLVKALGMYRKPIFLRFRDNYVIPVEQFTTAYVYWEVFIRGDYDLQLSAPSPRILDIGANTGLFTLRMKQLFPEASIASFEPDVSNFQQLQNLIAVNGLSGVIPFQKGVGGTTRIETLYLHPANIGGHSIIPHDGAKTEQIELVSLHEALRELGGCCDLLKLDCEGAEHEILMSMTDASVDTIIGEIHSNPDRTIQHLKMLGYTVSAEGGLLVAHKQNGAGPSKLV